VAKESGFNGDWETVLAFVDRQIAKASDDATKAGWVRLRSAVEWVLYRNPHS